MDHVLKPCCGSQKSHLVKPSLNIQLAKDTHLGVKAEHDLKDLKSLNGHLAYKVDKGVHFLKADLLKKVFHVGSTWECKEDKLDNSLELEYGMGANKRTGCCGVPFIFRYANTCASIDNVKFITILECGQQCTLKMKTVQKLNDKLTIALDEEFALCCGKEPWQFGFKVDLEL